MELYCTEEQRISTGGVKQPKTNTNHRPDLKNSPGFIFFRLENTCEIVNVDNREDKCI